MLCLSGMSSFFLVARSCDSSSPKMSCQLTSRVKGSEQLISSEKQSNTANYKFTYSVEIVPVCKDDLVCLPRSQARAWGNISYVSLSSVATLFIHQCQSSMN